ncbi:MAG: hypothetical protein FD180_1860 [Planctomycetota bacterium]|nr:MAG: hypothetical protein FD180_1860 [Planctomycetota bacterium]
MDVGRDVRQSHDQALTRASGFRIICGMKSFLLAFALATSVFAQPADPVEAVFDRPGVAAIPLKDLKSHWPDCGETFLVTQDGEALPWSLEGDLLLLPVPRAGVVRLLRDGGAAAEVKAEAQDAPRTRVPRSVERIEKDLIFDRLETASMRLIDGSGGAWLWMAVANGAKVEIPWGEWRKTVKVSVRFQPMRTPKTPHAVELWWDGKKAADATWTGGAAHTAEFGTLELRTEDGPSPRVIASGPMGQGPLYLDWIEIDGPRIAGPEQASWIGERSLAVELRDLKGGRLDVVFSMGKRARVLDPGGALAIDGPVLAASAGALIRPKSLTRVHAARDPEKGVEWLVLAPAAFGEALAPLVDRRREQGLSAAFFSVEQAIAAGGGDLPAHDAIRRFLQHAATAWPEPKLKFVLLAGDAERGTASGIPAGAGDALGAGWTATDGWYARVDDDELPDLAIGRWPARTPEEAGALLAKVKRFEDSTPGEWRRRVHLVLGTAGFGQGMDNMLKSGGMKIAGDLVPDSYAFRVQSTLELDLPFTYPPREYNAFLTQRVNDGCMVFAYSGHGWEHGLQSLKWEGKRYPILDVALAKNFDAKSGLPMAFLFACLTGSFDEKEDCLCEALVRNPGGPVAAIGSSAISHPYADIIFAKELMTVMFAKRAPTIGQGVMAAKRRCLKPPDGDAMRAFIDGMAAGAVGGLDAQARYRLDGSMAYNLFGDPATRIPWPGRLKVECAKEAAPGATIEVTGSGELGDGTAVVTFEAERLKSIEPVEKVDPKAEGAEEAMKRNWKRMNEAVAVRQEFAMKAGEFTVTLKVPEGIPEGDYLVKVYASDAKKDAIGCKRVRIVK